MKFFQVIVAWLKTHFVWSTEDFFFITGGITTLEQIHFDPTNSMFALAVGSVLKGAMSMLSITLGSDKTEDLVLMVGGFVTLYQIHFDIHSQLFALTVGAILKAGFGVFGLIWPFPTAPAGPGPIGEEARLATPGVPPPAPTPANRATAGPLKPYKAILREPPHKQ